MVLVQEGTSLESAVGNIVEEFRDLTKELALLFYPVCDNQYAFLCSCILIQSLKPFNAPLFGLGHVFAFFLCIRSYISCSRARSLFS